MTKFNQEHLERILVMADDKGETWDFSENDTKALKWVLRRLDYYASWEKRFVDALVKIRDIDTFDCVRYVKLADEIACDTLTRWEEHHG